ncbi:MAG TPA: LLM class flavin-dependent oxidoreductase [Frankiaceae bacterium]|jgi:alkanesulfonate monooxygenase SsuD/methylene tetrahydromethanopterin reductase-like flavin-dependent oxidoreductase (luciferase family)|nr:LLM class flavin-dependent oxidoreductase [Frankiaceae bacterium]
MTALGLFVDLRRLTSSRRSAASHVSHTLDLLAGAESLGCEAVWFTEHHSFEDGYLPQPLVLAAALAARTKTMRLGTGVLLAALRHPRHIAEEAALVDLISGGRVELGLGAGYARGEYDAFGVDMARRFDRTDAAALEVERLLASGEVTPGPVQQPLPLWLGYQGPKGAGRAGRAGMGLLSLDRSLVRPYRAGLEERGDDWSQARMGGLVEIIVSDDPPEAAERLLPHWVHQQNTYRALRRKPDGSKLSPIDADRARESLAKTGTLGSLQVLDVDSAVAELRARLEGLPAEHVYAWMSLGDMPEDLTQRHLELWCGPVREALRAG